MAKHTDGETVNGAFRSFTTTSESDDPIITPDVPTEVEDSDWYTFFDTVSHLWQFDNANYFLRIFVALGIAFISIFIAYYTNNLFLTVGTTVILCGFAQYLGILPFIYVVIYAILAGGIAYVKGNAHA